MRYLERSPLFFQSISSYLYFMVNILLAVALVALQIPDIVTTNQIIKAGGRELNPLVRLLMKLGALWWVPKFVVAVVCAWIFITAGDEDNRWAMIAVVAIYLAVVFSNYRQVRRLKKRGLLP